MNEGMMAVLVASTAFSGLTAIVIGQIQVSKPQAKWKYAKLLLIISSALGVLVATFSSLWFMISILNGNANMALIIALFFIVQLFLFWIPASSFWSEKQETTEI